MTEPDNQSIGVQAAGIVIIHYNATTNSQHKNIIILWYVIP